MVALVKFVTHWSGAGEEGQWGIYANPQGAVTQGQLETAVNSLCDQWGSNVAYAANLRSFLAIDQAYDKITAYYYPDALGPSSVTAQGTIGHAQGVGTGAILAPLQQSAVVSLETGHAGASYRGRCYVPTTGVGLAAGHQYDDTTVGELGRSFAGGASGDDNICRNYAESLADGTTDCDVFSRTLNIATAITSVIVDSKVDVQRRRAMSQVPTLRTTFPLVGV